MNVVKFGKAKKVARMRALHAALAKFRTANC